MKKLFPLILCLAFAYSSHAQSVSFTLTTAPCFNDGVLTANFTGFTSPVNVTWTTTGTTGTAITHSGVTGLSDALTSYSGGPVYISVVEACCSTVTAYNYYPGMPPFTYAVSSTPASCPALGTATATVTGGTSPYTYSWFDLATSAVVSTSNPASMASGGYGITITDAAGCQYGSLVHSDSIAIYSIPAFTVAVTNTPAGCTNGTASVVAVGSGATLPVSYLWSNAATTSSISGLTRGSYTVDVTDATGCVSTGYTYVNQTVTITAPVTATPATCIATNGAVIAFGAGGTPPYTYVWSNGATTQSQTGLSSAYYTVDVTDAHGCIGTSGGYVSASTPISATYATTPSSCTSPTGSATLTLTGGTLPYTIAWYTTPPQSGLTATAVPAGNYNFHVVDAAGCVQNGTVVIPPVNIITSAFTATSALCTLSTGGLTVYPSGGALPYHYLWSTGATTAGISGVASGMYTVSITDNVGCQVHPYHYVPVYSPVSLGLTTTPASCIFTSDGAASVTAWGGTLPYTYSWTGGGTTSTISGLHYGNYSVDVRDASGCYASAYDYVGYNPAGTSCYCTISGTVYDDANGNCVQDAGEAGIPHIQIYCSGIGYTYTDLSGHYSFMVPSGTYTISETVMTFYPLSSCQLNNISVTAAAATGCTHTVDFANSISTIHDTHISTWDYNRPIPGHTYTQVSVISNDGTVTESSVLAGYEPDGQVFAPTFVSGGIFAGAPYWYNTAAGFPTLSPGAGQHFLINYAVPTSVPLATDLVFKDSVAYVAPITNWLTDYSPWNNVDYFHSLVVSSYDPNFKEVSPAGTGPTGLITYKDSTLEYMVHFQNTGTAPAENIVVLDTLDNNLDWTSLRPVYMTAQGQVNLTQVGSYKIAKFSFPNINLPTQASNDVTSNGMFTYTIKTRRGLPVGTQFKNSASIYFDYNEPVKTNSTLNTLGSVLPNSVTSLQTEAHNSFSIYPNPAGRSFNIAINCDAANDADMNVSDVAGKVLMSQTIAMKQGVQTILIDASQLAPGVYFVSMNENGKVETQKLVIMK